MPAFEPLSLVEAEPISVFGVQPRGLTPLSEARPVSTDGHGIEIQCAVAWTWGDAVVKRPKKLAVEPQFVKLRRLLSQQGPRGSVVA